MTLETQKLPCVILAGGRSSRMGSNKSLATLGGVTLLSHVAARMTPQASAMALNAPEDFASGNDLRRVPDTLPGQLGPLAGVLAALRDTSLHHPDASHVMTVPTDGPFLPPDVMARLAAAVDAQTISIASSAGNQHPLVALWPVSLADALEAWILADGKRRVRDFQRRYRLAEVIFPLIETEGGVIDPFLNVNTPDDLLAAERWLEAVRR